MLAALALAAALLLQLARPHTPGTIFRTALLAGGLIAYALQMLTQPNPFLPDALLEPGQWIALAALTLGALLYLTQIPISKPSPHPAVPHLKESL